MFCRTSLQEFARELIEDVKEHGHEKVAEAIGLIPKNMGKTNRTTWAREGRCPECGGVLTLLELNKSSRTMVPGKNTMVDCQKCDWGYLSGMTMTDFLRLIKDASDRGEEFDFTEYYVPYTEDIVE